MKFLALHKSVNGWRLIVASCLLVLTQVGITSLWVDLHILPQGVSTTVAGLVLGMAWGLVIRFLLLDSWKPRWWLGMQVGVLILILMTGKMGMVLGVLSGGFFLTFRRYRPWRNLTPRQRALGFGLGLPVLVALYLGRRFWGDASGNIFLDRMRYLGGWSLVNLTLFWLFSLVHLVLKMRLHFLRLRPKLAVNAVLIGGIPLVLFSVLGLVILYTGLGGSRAIRARDTLESWRQMTAEGTDLADAVFDTTFVWPAASPALGTFEVAPPPGVSGLAAELVKILPATTSESRTGSAVNDTTDWFVFDKAIWLMRWQALKSDQPRVKAWRLGVKPLKALSGVLGAAIDISSIDVEQDEDGLTVSAPSEEDRKLFPGLKVSSRDIDPGSPFWNRFSYFGGTLFPLLKYRDKGLEPGNVFINLKVGWPELKADFVEGDQNINLAVVVVLGLLVFLFLVLEMFAIFFGVRITEGIVTAVHALHRGITAVAKGDLETRIKVPNEDEFGDLAAGFNEMTISLQQGREMALANDRLQQELATARSIQERLLPGGFPTLEGFEVVGTSIPSREIGGDYYDFLAQGKALVGIAIGDVSGKGMPAALLMSNLQASLHGQVLHPGSVSSVVARVNELLVRSTDPHMFATFFYGLLDTDSGDFTCTNAGHNPPLVVRRNGTIEELSRGGLLLGMLEDQVYQQDTVTLDAGDVIVMYTDGITEAVGPGVEEDDPEAMFGEDALRRVVLENPHLPAAGIQEAILAAVAAHTAGQPQSDDITLVVIRRRD